MGINHTIRVVYGNCLVCSTEIRRLTVDPLPSYIDTNPVVYTVCSFHCKDVYALNPLVHNQGSLVEVLVCEPLRCSSTWGPYKCTKNKDHDGYCGDGSGLWPYNEYEST